MLTALLIICLIFLSLVALFIAFLCIPMRMRLTVQKNVPILRIYFFGIPFLRYPKAKKAKIPKKKAAKPTSQTKENATLHLLKSAKSLDTEDTDRMLKDVKTFLTELTSFTRQSKATLHRLHLTPPPTDDAANAALLYTALSGAAAGVLEILDQNTKLQIESTDAVRITANYTNQEADLQLDISLSFPPYRAITALTPILDTAQNYIGGYSK